MDFCHEIIKEHFQTAASESCSIVLLLILNMILINWKNVEAQHNVKVINLTVNFSDL